jgi:hypothetical protein
MRVLRLLAQQCESLEDTFRKSNFHAACGFGGRKLLISFRPEINLYC